MNIAGIQYKLAIIITLCPELSFYAIVLMKSFSDQK